MKNFKTIFDEISYDPKNIKKKNSNTRLLEEAFIVIVEAIVVISIISILMAF